MTKEQRSELLDEYYKVYSFVQAYDPYFISIKNWGVTVTGAALAVGLSRENNRPLLVFSVALALSIAFWFTEVLFKNSQLAHLRRVTIIEEGLRNDSSLESPAIAKSYDEGKAENQKKQKWRGVMFWRHVMLPHVIFSFISLGFILYECVKRFR
jgi:hypothetical protein